MNEKVVSYEFCSTIRSMHFDVACSCIVLEYVVMLMPLICGALLLDRHRHVHNRHKITVMVTLYRAMVISINSDSCLGYADSTVALGMRMSAKSKVD